MTWKIIESKSAIKEVLRLPKKIAVLYYQLLDDLVNEGPYPHGWDTLLLKGQKELRIRLTREYRVIIQAVDPNIIVIKVAHRKDAYE